MNTQNTSKEQMEITPSLTQPLSKANELRNRRHEQVKEALLRKILDELITANYSVQDLVSFSDSDSATQSTQNQVEKHRARRHNQHAHIENRAKAVEARKVGRATQASKVK